MSIDHTFYESSLPSDALENRPTVGTFVGTLLQPAEQRWALAGGPVPISQDPQSRPAASRSIQVPSALLPSGCGYSASASAFDR